MLPTFCSFTHRFIHHPLVCPWAIHFLASICPYQRVSDFPSSLSLLHIQSGVRLEFTPLAYSHPLDKQVLLIKF